MIDPCHIWSVIYIARSNRSHPPTSPNTGAWHEQSLSWLILLTYETSFTMPSPNAAPARKNVPHVLLTYETSFTMRGATALTLQPHQVLRLPRKDALSWLRPAQNIWNVSVQCAGQHDVPSNLTKCCTCQAKLQLQNLREICWKRMKHHLHCGAYSGMIRPWTRHLAHARWPRLPFVLRRCFALKNQHFAALRLSTQISPNAAPATKSDAPTSPNAAPATKSETPTSPNGAPATKNDSHDWSCSHLKRQLQCVEQQHSPSNLTKYSAPARKNVPHVLLTYETSCTMRGATALTLQPHQILRLPGKMPLMIGPAHLWNVMYNAQTNKSHPNTAPATQNSNPKSKRNLLKTDETSFALRGLFGNDPTMNSSSRTRPLAEVTFRASEMLCVKKSTFRGAPAIYPDFTKCGPCHEKWRSNITKCCACHEKWHSDITKWCACHEKWHCKITECCACHEKWRPDITKWCACQEKWHPDISTCCACHE